MATHDLSVIVPCYNESEGITAMRARMAAVMPELRRRGSVQLVFVDDGSSDGTGDQLTKAFSGWPELLIVRHERNRGLGQALRTDYTVMRADAQVSPMVCCTSTVGIGGDGSLDGGSGAWDASGPADAGSGSGGSP